LRDDVLVQINSSDHNPAVRVGLSPKDSWELNTPQLLKYCVPPVRVIDVTGLRA
jgi:histidine ammonia-lyase